MTEYDLQRFITGNGKALKNILGCMFPYNANITVSYSYFYNHRKELEVLIEKEVLSTIWFNFSSAENYWADLTNVLNVGFNSYVPCK